MDYLKYIHVTAVILSFSGFFLRGIWMLSGSSLLYKKSVKIFPHIIDTILLGSALMMLYFFQWSVLDNAWLQVKIIALLVYIFLGTVALKSGQSMTWRCVAWVCGLIVFGFIVSVAVSKSAEGLFRLF